MSKQPVFWISTFFFLNVCPFVFAQKLQITFKEARLDTTENRIIVVYDLEAKPNRYYIVSLHYSNNGGNSYKGPLRSVKGEVGDSIQAGKDKKIAWDFHRDNPYFKGENIIFKVDAIEIPKISTGGPEYALNSLIIPGWGDTKVRNGRGYGWITALAYGTVGTGLALRWQASRSYEKHAQGNAQDLAQHDKYYNRAKTFDGISQSLLFTGATVWLGDVIGVALRGVRNRKMMREGNKPSQNRGEPLLQPFYHNTGNGHRAGLRLKF